MEKNEEEANPWVNPNEIEDILHKEIFPRLTVRRGSILNLVVCQVNKAWRALFMKNSFWKSVIQRELPFIDTTETTDHYKKLVDSLASFKVIRCGHPKANVSKAIRVCPCTFCDLPKIHDATASYLYSNIDLGIGNEHVVHFTGNKNELIRKRARCACHEKIPTREYLKFPLICSQCYEDVKNCVDIVGRRGSPEAERKWGNGIWIHKELQLSEEILVAKPVPNSPSLFVAITNTESARKLVLLTINVNNVGEEELAACIDATMNHLQISNDGNFVAVYAEKGTQGFVYNMETRTISCNFSREPHQVVVSFPVAFFTYENKEYLIAGRQWNKIDLYDPATGESLKERDVTNHHSECFWSTLHVSPDQKTLVSCGPIPGRNRRRGSVLRVAGVCVTFSIENWMKGDLYAMERSKFLMDSYEWDYPMCWLDNTTLAIWGDADANGSVDNFGLPVVRSIPINLNDQNCVVDRILWVPLGESPLVFDEYLLSLNPRGVEVVDVRDDHVLELHNQREVSHVLCYNQYSKHVASIKKNDPKVLVLSHIHFYDKPDKNSAI